MKLLKIGSSPSCDIVINDPFVSAIHAEITVLDSGEIFIEDKNSRNGTFVNNNRINPNVETPVRRGDHVLLAKCPLPWGRVPQISSQVQYKQMVNIGSSFRNDIVVSAETVSRYHAMLKIDKKNRVFICDNGSRNGTQVNGQKVPANRDVRIKRGDNILVAGEDITAQVEVYLPKNQFAAILGSVATIAVITILSWIWGPNLIESCVRVDPVKYQPAVVYIQSSYHYEISAGGFKFRYPFDDSEYLHASSTGFFLDRDGRIGTARHVAVPWDEAYAKDTRESLKDDIRNMIHSDLPIAQVTNAHEFDILMQSTIGQMLWEKCEGVLGNVNACITQLHAGNYDIDGVMDFLAVGYNGANYSSLNEFHRCFVVAESGDARKDVALLQLNDKVTPANVKYTFDISKVDNTPVRPVKEILYTIGYPFGFIWSYDRDNREIKSSVVETKCNKTPSRYDFEFQATSHPGSSGSPVFLKNGKLVGVLSGGYANSEEGPTRAAHAYFLRTLYEESIGKIAK